MTHAARALGLGVMLGCMIESELGIGAGAAARAAGRLGRPRRPPADRGRAVPRPRLRRRPRRPVRRARHRRRARHERAPRDLRRGAVRDPQRQDRPRRDPLRAARDRRGDRLRQRRPPRRRGRAVLRPARADRGDGGRGGRAGRRPAADRRRTRRRQAVAGVARRAGRGDERSAWTSRRACTACSPTTPSWSRRPPRARPPAASTCASAPPTSTRPTARTSATRRCASIQSVGIGLRDRQDDGHARARQAARERGERSVFVATGQTGIAISGWGIAVDHVISDYIAGAAERLVYQGAEHGDLLFVEGQGSLYHPGYSGVTLGLLHGAAPRRAAALPPGRPDRDPLLRDGRRSRRSRRSWRTTRRRCEPVRPARVAAIALNTKEIADEAEARAAIAAAAEETGLRRRRSRALRLGSAARRRAGRVRPVNDPPPAAPRPGCSAAACSG